MRWHVVGFLVLALEAGCVGPRPTPSAVQPTLAAIETLGVRCGDGLEDNVPSGLFQWSCSGALEAAQSTVLVEGNEEGVAGITLFIKSPGQPGIARSGFGRLVDAVPPLSTAPALKTTLVSWTGAQQVWIVGGARLSAQCDASQCIVGVITSPDALRPLHLP